MAATNQPSTAPRVARFGAYEADARSGELRKSGMRLKVGVQPFEVLAVLLEKHGELVTREELRERIWPSGTFVDFENGLNKAVAKLRGVLNDDPSNPRFIETVPRRGYRFVAGVEFVESGPNAAISSKQNRDAQARPILGPRSSRRLGWLAAGTGLAAVLVAGAFVYSQRHNRPRELRSAIHSIAVLPFDNVSGGSDQDYFAAGMTDEIVKNLRGIPSLRVASPAAALRFKHTGIPLGQVGREMGVDAVIEGTSAHAGDRGRLTVRLFSVSDNDYLWAGDYTGNVRQLMAAQDEITQTIAQQIRIQSTSSEKPAAPKHVPPPEAYEAYLEGRYYYLHWGNRWTLVWWKKSCDSFQQAIQLDPEYALAYAGLAECYSAMNTTGIEVPEKDRIAPEAAMAMATKALQLDDTLAEAHAALGSIYLDGWQWPEAFPEFRRAAALQPNDPLMHSRLAKYYRVVGDMRQAVAESEEAKRLDPGSVTAMYELGWMYFLAGDDAQAETEFKNAIAQEPGLIPAERGLFEIYHHQHKEKEAIAALADFENSTRHPDRARRVLEIYQAQGYEPAFQYAGRQEIQDDYHENAKPFYLAADYARLGEKEKALAYLEQAYAGHAPQLQGLKTNRDFSSVSSDSRFQSILKKLHLDNPSPDLARK